MNPSSAGIWCNPPPPGTDEDESKSPPQKESSERVIDRIDPFVKSAEYLKYERKMEHRRRTRSRSRHRRRRSHSRTRHRHRRRRYSSSRSRSRSRSRRRHKRSRHSRSHSRSRSPSKSKSHKSRRSRHHRSRSRRRSRSPYVKTEPEPEETRPKEDDEVEEEEDEDETNENMFKNDGSFMEMFKKMQEEQLQKSQAESGTAAETKVPQPAFGKRRGGKVLKTGLVQKNKNAGQEEGDAQDAWTLYMKEVKRYKEACCDDDSKTRLLVK